MSKKRWWLRFHVWLGISVGLLWALQGLTGALLVFNRDLQGISYAEAAPERSDVLLPLDSIFAGASTAAGARVTKLEAFGARPYFLLAYYEDRDGHERTLIVDGRSGNALDDRSTTSLSRTVLAFGRGSCDFTSRSWPAIVGSSSLAARASCY